MHVTRMTSFLVLAASSCALDEELTTADVDTTEQAVAGAPFSTTPAWTVLFEIAGRPFCSATVLNERWLLTAAHCFEHAEGFPVEDLPADQQVNVTVSFAHAPGLRTVIAASRAQWFKHPGHPAPH